MSEKKHFTVARNEGYSANSIEVRERHNERKNENYYNADIVPEREHFNHHFQQWQFPDGTPVTYEQRFNQMLTSGKIVKRGLKEDAKVFNELIFDVNTKYFDERGGYDFAVKFYEEAYRMAVKEIGGEQYILSAVMHADERNVALSEQLGRDVYHYHLHVVYVPVVEKKVLWTKRCKDPALVGTVKEIIPQISHSKKWAKYKDENGKWIDTYSLLQDHFHDHMKAAGFDGFERGERGSTKEHLEVLEYKIQQDNLRLDELAAEKDKQQKQVDTLVEATKVRSDILAAQEQINAMARPSKTGNNKIVSNTDWKKVSEMAKRTALLDEKIKDTQKQINNLKQDRDKWKNNYERLWGEVKDFIKAIRSMPQRLLAFIAEHKQNKSQNREVR